MNEREVIDLKSLVGEHLLTGVDIDKVKHQQYEWRPPEDCEVLRFVLDGITYEGIENPDDGYRSSMDGLYIAEVPVKNTFAPVKVLARHREKGKYGDADDVLELLDVANGNVILEIGTEAIDDYYPGFCSHWHPERMATNTPPCSGDSSG